MKRLSFFLSLVFVFCSLMVSAQLFKPAISFEENPQTHNAHMTFDGKYYYTCNAGVASMGQISKFTVEGKLVERYNIELDMRSIMYHPKKKQFYICCYDKCFYKITDLERGLYKKVYDNLYSDAQSSLALGPKGKYLYAFSYGKLEIIKFKTGKVVKTVKGFDHGSDFINGSSAIAVDNKYIYTWNGYEKMIFAYNKKGEKVKTFRISDGEYGISLSAANGLVFVSIDGNYDYGTWYGYDLWK